MTAPRAVAERLSASRVGVLPLSMEPQRQGWSQLEGPAVSVQTLWTPSPPLSWLDLCPWKAPCWSCLPWFPSLSPFFCPGFPFQDSTLSVQAFPLCRLLSLFFEVVSEHRTSLQSAQPAPQCPPRPSGPCFLPPFAFGSLWGAQDTVVGTLKPLEPGLPSLVFREAPWTCLGLGWSSLVPVGLQAVSEMEPPDQGSQ